MSASAFIPADIANRAARAWLSDEIAVVAAPAQRTIPLGAATRRPLAEVAAATKLLDERLGDPASRHLCCIAIDEAGGRRLVQQTVGRIRDLYSAALHPPRAEGTDETMWPSWLRWTGAIVAAYAALACEPLPDAPVPLIHHGLWRLAAPGEDPFAHELDDGHRPCGDEDWSLEPPVLEVQTTACNYITLVQPALFPVRQGDWVRLVAWHVMLSSPMPVEGHMALAIGHERVWETFTDIPAEESVLRGFEPVLDGAPGAAPVAFHVHNHGDNSWKLLEVTSGPAEVYGERPAQD